MENDEDKNFNELEKRARQGDAQAQYGVGIAYLSGYGIPKDDM